MQDVPPAQIARDSHYVPMALLRRWSDDGVHVFTYRTVVSHPNVPEWRRRPIRGVAYQRDLYTVFAGGKELDDFERWLCTEYEHPALEVIERLVSGSRLTPHDWRSLARLVAVQDVRTPLSFIESLKRWDQEIPEILNSTLSEAIKRMQEAKEKGVRPERKPTHGQNEFADILRVKIEPAPDPDSDRSLVRAEVPVGRRLWIASMRHLLKNAAEVLCRHRWSVAAPFGDLEWPLTDHPAIRLNYYKPGHYDFGGGWGNPGSEIMMPVSPWHLLYVQVGSKAANRFTFSREHTELVQRLLLERAHRWVFARRPTEWVASVRPRAVDPERLAAERKAWDDWHHDQLLAESSS